MSNSVETEDLKLEAHNIAVGHIEEDIKELDQLMDDNIGEEDEITQGQLDKDALSHNSEDQNNLMVMKQKMIGLKAKLALLNQYKNAKPTAIVDPGSLVFVQDQVFYVSTSVESFESNGHKVTCISVESPIYKAMKGLKADSDFVCNGKSYSIKKIA